MSIEKPTKSVTEQQFEAEVRAAVRKALPWAPDNQIDHQTTFAFKFGHATVMVKGDVKDEVRARADVLISIKGVAVAVLELKRPGLGIDAADCEQGLSYARMIHPRPPLVIVTDGKETQVLETHSGKEWQPETQTESALKGLFQKAASVASGDLKRAVGHLMGNDPSIWVQAVKQITARKITSMTKGWGSPEAAFVDDFLLRRKAACAAHHYLEKGDRLLMIAGPPLSGKSNALREVALRAHGNPNLAVLYLDADRGLNLFEKLAELLADTLDWPVTGDEAKQWLKSISRSGGPALVLALDNVSAEQNEVHRAVDALTSDQYGPGVRVLLAVDDVVAESMLWTSNGRQPSAIADRVEAIPLGPMDDEEFELAEKSLREHSFSIVAGGRYSAEFRQPWMVRVMCASRARDPELSKPNFLSALPPVPGLEIFAHIKECFDTSRPPYSRYRELALALRDDLSDPTRPHELVLEQLSVFIVRQSVARRHLDQTRLDEMIHGGLLKETKSQSGDNVYVVRLPELLAFEMARLLVFDISVGKNQDESRAGLNRALNIAGSLPLAELIFAQAFLEAGRMNLWLLEELANTPPRRAPLKPGTRIKVHMPNVGLVDMTHQEDGSILFEKGSFREVVPADQAGPHATSGHVDVLPFLILSSIATYPLALVDEKGELSPVNEQLLILVGACRSVLRRPGGDPDVSSIPVHDLSDDLSIVCHAAGITEPITWAIFKFLAREETAVVDAFIEQVIESSEPALVARVSAALYNFAGYSDRQKAEWARVTFLKKIKLAVPETLAHVLMHD